MSKDIKKALEHCVEWDCGNCPNRDELGSGETVCRGRLLPEVLGYVSDLEAKLSESKKQCQQCKHLNKKIELNIKNKLMSELAEKDKTIATLIEDSKTSKELLKKQLAEKEKEIDNLYDRLNSKQKFYEMSLEKDYKEYLSRLDKLEKQCDKDKISFTIQQLEKVREFCREKFNWWENSELEGNIYDKSDVSNAYFDIEANIEERIKQLKEGK